MINRPLWRGILFFFSLLSFIMLSALVFGNGIVSYTGSDTCAQNLKVNESQAFSNNTWVTMNHSGIMLITQFTNGTNTFPSNLYTYNSTHIKIYANTTYTNTSGWNITYVWKNSGNGTIEYNFTWPWNNSILPNQTLLWPSAKVPGVSLNFTTNVSFGECHYMFNMNGTYFKMENGSFYNRTWNISVINFIPKTVGSNEWYNISFRCRNRSADQAGEYTNISYTNSSLYRFKVNSQNFTLGVESAFTNGSYFNDTSMKVFNVSIYGYAPANCSMVLNGTTVFPLLNGSTTNLTAQTTQYYWNRSSLNKTEDGGIANISAWNQKPQNITYYCEDAWGNKTWFNQSTSASAYRQFWYDITPPNITVYNFTDQNFTYGNQYTIIANVQDYSPITSCWIRAHYENGTIYKFTNATIVTQTGFWTNCTYTLRPDEIKVSGKYILEFIAVDRAGNLGLSGRNVTVLLQRFYAGWNMVTIPFNITFAEISVLVPNISYVSYWNNNNKTYTTYTKGGSTNGAVTDYMGNATYIYVTRNFTMMMNLTSTIPFIPTAWTNITLWGNTSGTSGWNQVGITNESISLNATMFNTLCANMTFPVYNNSLNSTAVEVNFTSNNTWIALQAPYIIHVTNVSNTTHTIHQGNYTWNSTHIKLYLIFGGTTVGENYYNPNQTKYNVSYTYAPTLASGCTDITYASWFDAQYGRYCSLARGKSTTSCYPTYNATSLKLPIGSAIWLYTKNNITYNRTVVQQG